MNYWINFVENLELLRTEENLSKARLVQALEIDDNTLRFWLNGKFYPHPKRVMKTADFFKCSSDYLFGLTDTREFTPKAETAAFIPRFTALEKENKLNDNRVAKYCGIGNSAVAKWRRFNRFPNTDTMLKLAELFNCSLEYLFGREN